MDFLQTLLNWFSKGGIIMWPILIFSVYGMSLCYERWMHYLREDKALAGSWAGMPEFAGEAAAFPAGTGSAAGRLSRAALSNGHLNDGARVEKARHAFQEEQAGIEKHLGTISVIASLLPMLGLLGTVIGMIDSFNAIAEHGSGNPRIVADGISVALITTEAGLIASIPLFYLHQLLSTRADVLTRRLDEFMTQILPVCSAERTDSVLR